MKIKQLSLIAIVAMAMTACSGSGNNSNAEAEQAEGNKTEQVTPEAATFDIFENGEMFVDYTKPNFTVKEGSILPCLHNDNVRIDFVSGLSPENYNEYKDVFENSYKDREGYSYKELEINGFKSIMCTYVDHDFGTTYCADYYIDFGDQAVVNGYYGVKACVSSEVSADFCVADDVMAILNTVKIVKK